MRNSSQPDHPMLSLRRKPLRRAAPGNRQAEVPPGPRRGVGAPGLAGIRFGLPQESRSRQAGNCGAPPERNHAVHQVDSGPSANGLFQGRQVGATSLGAWPRPNQRRSRKSLCAARIRIYGLTPFPPVEPRTPPDRFVRARLRCSSRASLPLTPRLARLLQQLECALPLRSGQRQSQLMDSFGLSGVVGSPTRPVLPASLPP